MCCWHSLWLRCVSSRAVCHSLVTQGELLISQERDVLASASGSWEDKQVARTTDATYAPEVLRKTLSATRVLLPSLHSPRRHTLTHSLTQTQTRTHALAPCASPRSAWLKRAPLLFVRSLAHLWTRWLQRGLWPRRWKQSCDVRIPLWKSYVLKRNPAIFPLNSLPHHILQARVKMGRIQAANYRPLWKYEQVCWCSPD